ncbi:hypothetical protein [Isobaculum melis]|uniref:Uncharacterized protein n=1 Tax=Isobaculum melis TaxID=142588 RepID=A0A1H9T8Y0_9LACT|nr:hypothetical protein [Isobaculum melis]SER93596.1 hypothetical protein SAMN04488559_11163 [Isobaculum melis]
MIDKTHEKIEMMNEVIGKATGVNITLPKPNKRAIKVSQVTNGVVSTGLIAFGILTPYKWTIVAGGVGLLGSLIVGDFFKKEEK